MTAIYVASGRKARIVNFALDIAGELNLIFSKNKAYFVAKILQVTCICRFQAIHFYFFLSCPIAYLIEFIGKSKRALVAEELNQ